MTEQSKEKNQWAATASMLDDVRMSFGSHWTFNFKNDPKRLAFVLSRYKFAAKMACKNARVLELGCSDGIGSTILAEFSKSYTGVDLDKGAIEVAERNLSGEKFRFIYDDFLGKNYGSFDAVISLDVIEHIYQEFESLYFKSVLDNLSENGICVIGTPNITSVPYASKASQLGHVNMYSQDRLVNEMRKYFYQVFPFGMNDEMMHTGFAAMAHYLICVGFYKK